MEITYDIRRFKRRTEELLSEIANIKSKEEVDEWLKEFGLASSNLFNMVGNGKRNLK